MFMLPKETAAQCQQRAIDYEAKFGAENAANRATIKPLPAVTSPVSLFDLADHLAKTDNVRRVHGVIVNDF
jgi:hypothetical protein